MQVHSIKFLLFSALKKKERKGNKKKKIKEKKKKSIFVMKVTPCLIFTEQKVLLFKENTKKRKVFKFLD